MEYYKAFILVFAILHLLSAGVNAVAPGDQQSTCLTTQFPSSPGHGLVGAYTSTQRPLMDSYWYDRVVGSTGVWAFIEGNADNKGWRRGQIASCRTTVGATRSNNPAENNWFATQFISRSTAQTPDYALPITVNVSHTFLSCTPNLFRLHYYPSASNPGSSSGISNYIHIGDVDPSTNSLQVSTFNFNLASQYSGFYLAFQDQDSCGTVERVQVYRTICPSRTEGLVMYPETPTGTSAVSVTHQCIANAEVSGGGLMCNTDGSWTGSPSCSCVSGHVLDGGNCQACPAGQYQSGSSCLSCPANTIGTGVGVAECSCQANFYRAPTDSPSMSCTVPPSSVQNLQAPDNGRTNTSITIQWTAPVTTGGRSDLVYQISYRRIGSEQSIMKTTTQTSDQLTGLQPLSEYTIMVVSANGITEGLPNVAAITLQSRTATLSASTTEGVPGPPASVAVIDRAVIWQAPQSPNGILTGYIIRVYSDGNIGQAQIINVDVNLFYRQLTTSNLPDGNNLQVQVRGRTMIGAGEWSTPQPLSRAAFISCTLTSQMPVAMMTPVASQCPGTTTTITASPACSCANIATTIIVTQTPSPIMPTCSSPPPFITTSCPSLVPSPSSPCVATTVTHSPLLSCDGRTSIVYVTKTPYPLASCKADATTIRVTETPSCSVVPNVSDSLSGSSSIWIAVGVIIAVIIVAIIVVVLITVSLCCWQRKRSSATSKRYEMSNYYDTKS